MQAPNESTLLPTQFTPLGTKAQVWIVTPGRNVPLEAAMESAFWHNVAGKLSARDLIYLYPEDDRYFAILLVREVRGKFVRVSLVHKAEFESDADPASEADADPGSGAE